MGSFPPPARRPATPLRVDHFLQIGSTRRCSLRVVSQGPDVAILPCHALHYPRWQPRCSENPWRHGSESHATGRHGSESHATGGDTARRAMLRGEHGSESSYGAHGSEDHTTGHTARRAMLRGRHGSESYATGRHGSESHATGRHGSESHATGMLSTPGTESQGHPRKTSSRWVHLRDDDGRGIQAGFGQMLLDRVRVRSPGQDLPSVGTPGHILPGIGRAARRKVPVGRICNPAWTV